MNTIIQNIKKSISTFKKTVDNHLLQRYLALLVGIFLLASCQEEREWAILNKNANVEITVPKDVVLLKKDAAKTLSFSWAKPKLGVNVAIDYKLSLDKEENFKNPETFTTKKLSYDITIEKLNEILIDKGSTPGKATKVVARVEAVLSTTRKLISKVVSFNVTPYQTKVDITTPWGLVGSATPNGWGGPDVPFYKGSTSSEFVCFAVLKVGEIKFRKDNAWTVNYGKDAKEGTLKSSGDDIKVTKTSGYKIVFDTSKLTYSLEKFSWGLVGDATPNGWNGPDVYFYKTAVPDQWICHATLKVGKIKFRKDNAWTVNYGKDAKEGTLKSGGDNIKVTKAGDYKIIFNTKKLIYSLEKYSWGLVGDFSNWKAPDQKLKYDYITNTYQIKGVTLTKGGFKFRLNEAWTVNLGLDKAGVKGSLKQGSDDNIPVENGTYDISLDLSDSKKPKYTIKKK